MPKSTIASLERSAINSAFRRYVDPGAFGPVYESGTVKVDAVNNADTVILGRNFPHGGLIGRLDVFGIGNIDLRVHGAINERP